MKRIDPTDRACAIDDAAKSLADLAQLNRRAVILAGNEPWQLFEDIVHEHLARLQKLIGDPK